MSFEETFDVETSNDSMAVLLRDLENLSEYHRGITRLLPRVLTILKQERKEMLYEAERRFSDLWGRIDIFREEDEDSWITAMRIIDHYKNTYKQLLDAEGKDE